MSSLEARLAAKAALASQETSRAVAVASSSAQFAADLKERIKAAVRGPDPIEHVTGTAAARILAARERKDPAGWSDIRRIISLPTHDDPTTEEVEEFCRGEILADAFEKGFRLFPKQVEGLSQYDEHGSPFCPIGVGLGKTLLALMIAQRASKRTEIRGRPNNRRTLLICYTGAYGQLVDRDIAWARTKVPLTIPFYAIGHKSVKDRLLYAKSSRSGCYIVPMSHVSSKSFDEFLQALRPDTIILDEAHQCSNPTAARTKRIRRYCDEHNPDFVPLSGTMTRKTIRDYHHLLKASRGSKMPLPESSSLASEWGMVLDSGAGEPSDAATGPIKPLVDWARRKFPTEDFAFSTEGIRHAYMRRLCSAPGVVSSGDADIGVSLILANREIPQEECEAAPGWKRLQQLIADVEQAWLTPNGDEIEHAIHTWKWMFELSAGFYNQLTWPTATEYAERKGMSVEQAAETLAKARQYHVAHQAYSRTLRKWLDAHAKPGLDTPFLVGSWMHRHPEQARAQAADLYESWTAWKGLDFAGRPDRDSSAVRICPYKVNRAVKWVREELDTPGGIIWAYHEDMARWCHEALREAGHDPLLCLAGEAGNRAILDHENSNRIVVASISAHGTAKNLQHFSRSFLLQTPRPPAMAEQLLGRTHRSGQEADEVLVQMCNTGDFDHQNFAACVNDAVYIHTTTDNRQKLVYATYEMPLPRMYPAAALRARGFEVSALSRKQQQVLDEKFQGIPASGQDAGRTE